MFRNCSFGEGWLPLRNCQQKNVRYFAKGSWAWSWRYIQSFPCIDDPSLKFCYQMVKNYYKARKCLFHQSLKICNPLGKGSKKHFLWLFPQQRTLPTHPTDLGLQKFSKISWEMFRTRNQMRVAIRSGCVTKILALQRWSKIDFPPDFQNRQMHSFPIMYNTMG